MTSWESNCRRCSMCRQRYANVALSSWSDGERFRRTGGAECCSKARVRGRSGHGRYNRGLRVSQRTSCVSYGHGRCMACRRCLSCSQRTCGNSKGRLMIIAFALREAAKTGLVAAWDGSPPQQLGTRLSSRRSGSGVAQQSLLRAGSVELGPSSWQ